MTGSRQAASMVFQFRSLSRPLIASALAAAIPGAAHAAISQCVGTGPEFLCPPNVTTCTISTSREILKDSILDCTGVHISLTTLSADLWVEHGSFSLTAKSLSVASGGRIRAVADPTTLVGFAIAVEEQVNVSGKLQAPNAGSGSFVYIQAEGDVTVGGQTPVIDVAGSQISCDGGEIFISSGGTVTVNKRIDAHGKEAGDETNINAGGVVSIEALGDVRINDEIRAFGRFYDGGTVEIKAGGSAFVDWQSGAGLPKGVINIEGKNVDGYGGVLDISAAHSIVMSGAVSGAGGVSAGGGYGKGADVGLIAGCGGVSISGSMDIWGGADGGGTLFVISDGPITLSSTIDATSRKYGGTGGDVILSSGKSVSLTKTAVLKLDGHNPAGATYNGTGGGVLLQGCQVDLLDDSSAGAKVTALGWNAGSILIQGAATPLTSSQFSVRVGDKALVSGSGESVSVAPQLQVTQRRLGVCSNSATACQTNSSCSGGICQSANPDTEGSLAQFVPTPSIAQVSAIPACSVVCP